MRQQGPEPVVSDGEERLREYSERRIRQELGQRYRAEIENTGAARGLLLQAKIFVQAHRAAREASGRGWYLTV